MYLNAALMVGGDFPGPPDGSTRFPAALEIDFVRVFLALPALASAGEEERFGERRLRLGRR